MFSLGKIWQWGPLARIEEDLVNWAKKDGPELEALEEISQRGLGLYDIFFSLALALGPAAMVASVSTVRFLECLLLFVGGAGLIGGLALLRPVGSRLFLMPRAFRLAMEKERDHRGNEKLRKAKAEGRSLSSRQRRDLYEIFPEDRRRAAQKIIPEVRDFGRRYWGRARHCLSLGLLLCIISTGIHMYYLVCSDEQPREEAATVAPQAPAPASIAGSGS